MEPASFIDVVEDVAPVQEEQALTLMFTYNPYEVPGREPSGIRHWQASAWVWDHDQNFPACTAYICEPGDQPPILDYIQTADQYRRQGIAARLLTACRDRWPTLCTTEGISDEGIGLITKLGLERAAAA